LPDIFEILGQTTHVSVLSANALGAAGVQLAQRVLQGVEPDYQRLQGLFGGLVTPGMTLVVAPLSAAHDGSGGPYHHACSDLNLILQDLAALQVGSDGNLTGPKP
jgi:hypothetical protein